MRLDQALLLLLSSLSIKQHKRTLNWEAVNLWQNNVLQLFLDNNLLTRTKKATSIQCQNCVNHCLVDVTSRSYPKGTRYFAMCEDPFMHEQMGRMTIPAEQLNQWTFSIKQLAVLIAELLHLPCDISYKAGQETILLGVLESKAGRNSVVLHVEPLTLIINQTELFINELLYFDEGVNNRLKIDNVKIQHALKIKKITEGKVYTPNVDKNEQRKADTTKSYKAIQKVAVKLKKQHPNKPKTWIAQAIAKMPVAQGRSADTIRKNIII